MSERPGRRGPEDLRNPPRRPDRSSLQSLKSETPPRQTVLRESRSIPAPVGSICRPRGMPRNSCRAAERVPVDFHVAALPRPAEAAATDFGADLATRAEPRDAGAPAHFLGLGFAGPTLVLHQGGASPNRPSDSSSNWVHLRLCECPIGLWSILTLPHFLRRRRTHRDGLTAPAALRLGS